MKNLDADFEKEYKKLKRKINLQFVAISALISLVLTFVIYYLFYHNYTVLKHSFFSINIPIPINLIESFLIGTFLLSFGLPLIFKKSIILNRIPDKYKKRVSKILDDENNKLTEGDKAIPTGIVVAVIGIIAISILSVHCFGYNDTSIRFSDSNKIIVTTAEYNDFSLFKLKGYYDDGKVLLYGGEAYGIVSLDGEKSYDFGNVSEEMRDELMSVYNHRYTEVETIDDGIIYVENHL